MRCFVAFSPVASPSVPTKPRFRFQECYLRSEVLRVQPVRARYSRLDRTRESDLPKIWRPFKRYLTDQYRDCFLYGGRRGRTWGQAIQFRSVREQCRRSDGSRWIVSYILQFGSNRSSSSRQISRTGSLSGPERYSLIDRLIGTWGSAQRLPSAGLPPSGIRPTRKRTLGERALLGRQENDWAGRYKIGH